jgi:hypothetical protein
MGRRPVPVVMVVFMGVLRRDPADRDQRERRRRQECSFHLILTS